MPKTFSSRTRGIFIVINLSENPSKEVLIKYAGFFCDIFSKPESEGIRINMFNVSEADLAIVSGFLTAIIEEGFTQREEL